MKFVTITTDGACVPNPGKGSYAAILRYGSNFMEISGTVLATTNNRMELTAILQALLSLKEPCKVLIRTDSQTSIATCSKSGWKFLLGKKTKPPANYDLVKPILELMLKHEVEFEWVRGHNGDPDNERADQLANQLLGLKKCFYHKPKKPRVPWPGN